MRYLRLLVNIILPFFIITSCTQQEIDIFTQGGGRFDITLVDDIAKTRSLPSEITDEMANNFNLTINKENGVKAFKGSMQKYNEQQPSFAPGKYLISANLGENQVLALDAPYYEATPGEYEITAGETTTVAMTCTVANALASFAFENPEVVSSYLKSYEIITRIGDTEVSCTVGDGKNPYFQEDQTVEFILKGISAQDVPVEYTFATITKSERQKNYKYTLILGGSQEGDAQLNISVDAQVDIVSISETIPQEWLPKATVTAEGLIESGIIEHTETDNAFTAIINYQSFLPIEEMIFTLDFSDPNLSKLNKTYNLSSLSMQEKSDLNNAGILLPDLNTNSGNLDFTGITKDLLCANDGSSLDNIIKVKVLSNHRWSEEKQYTIRTIKPDFKLLADNVDTWTRTFSVKGCEITSGNEDEILSNMVYQYSTDGGNKWIDFNNGTTQIFSEQPETKIYKVRGLYRNALATQTVDFELEEPTQLPNSDMEDWSTADTDWEFPTYIPGTSNFWDTNNKFTFRYNIPWPKDWYDSSYNGFPAVSYSTSKHSGNRSAELRNTAAGPVGTSSVVYDNNRIAGMLYTGTYTGTTSTGGADGSVSIDEGKSFNSRPTKLGFWYTYEPYENDTYEVIIKIFDNENNIIGSGSFTSSLAVSEWTQTFVDINYPIETINKAAKIYVFFQSSNAGQGNVPYGKKREIYLADYGNETTHYGSILRIDDISLVYDK